MDILDSIEKIENFVEGLQSAVLLTPIGQSMTLLLVCKLLLKCADFSVKSKYLKVIG